MKKKTVRKNSGGEGVSWSRNEDGTLIRERKNSVNGRLAHENLK